MKKTIIIHMVYLISMLVLVSVGTAWALNIDTDSNDAVDLTYGGTNASLSDPGADRILCWDNSASAVTWCTVGTGLSISATPSIDIHAYLQDIVGITGTKGDLIYFDGSDWVDLAIGTDKYILQVSTDVPAWVNALQLDYITLPNDTDPDLGADYRISWDTDGANETGDEIIRGRDTSDNQFPVARKLFPIQVTVAQPNDLDDAVRDHFWFYQNDTGMTFTVTYIYCISDTDDTTLNIYEEDADGQNDALLDNDQGGATVEIATNGTGMYYMTPVTAIDNPTIETGHLLYIDFDDTDDPGQVKCTIRGWFNANVD